MPECWLRNGSQLGGRTDPTRGHRQWNRTSTLAGTVHPKKCAHGFCFAVLFCGYTLTDFPISTRLASLALWQSSDCPSASKATLMNMDKYFMWIHYERLHNHNKAKPNKTMCIFLGIYFRKYTRGVVSVFAFISNHIVFIIKYVAVWNFHASPRGLTYFICMPCTERVRSGLPADFSVILRINKLFYVLYLRKLASLRAHKQ